MQPKRRPQTKMVNEKAGAELSEAAARVGSSLHHRIGPDTTTGSSVNATMDRQQLGGHHLPSTSSSAFVHQPQPIGSGKQQISLGNKDLIIRMLAEIFQVKQDENGQVRWHQVSTSLVPISLYSRTTSRWLDYLLTAPLSIQANDPANTMSPDSRDFLLLLQQFHQQTKPVINQQQQFGERFVNGPAGQLQDAIVFQVVGHDFIDCQCKKILNVKIRQPGTRLGQASDYFVYWKDQASISASQSNQSKHFNLHHQQFSASSYASNVSFMHQATKQPTNQMLNPFHSSQHYDRQQLQSSHQQTWGLNFASMNDAKLFYDICSLNIVNLDFNSEYLKQLSMCDGRQQKQFATKTAGLSPSSFMLNQRRYQQGLRNSTILNQQQQTQQMQLQQQQQSRSMKRTVLKTLKQNTSTQQQRHSSEKPSSTSRCPSCDPYPRCLQAQSVMSSNENRHSMGRPCPVHGQQLSGGTIRARSRSTTRQPLRTFGDLNNSPRARSFSTPASPESEQCPVHRRRHRTNTDCELEVRRPAFGYLGRSTSRLQQQTIATGNPVRTDGGPEKPARGLLRSSYMLTSQEISAGRRQKQKGQLQGVVVSHSDAHHGHETSDRLLHSKPSTKTRYMGYLHNAAQQQDRAKKLDGHQIYGGTNATGLATKSNFDENNLNVGRGYPSNRSLFKKLQTGTETFDTFGHRDARVARAQYANSRNMKEFLSLDGGGLQSTFPTDYRFHRSKQARQAVADVNGGRRNNGHQAEFIARSSMQRQPARANTETQPLKPIDKSVCDKNLTRTIAISQPLGRTDSRNGLAAERLTSSDTNVCAGYKYLPNAESRGCASIQCNASTTTEDLPMDSSMKKRMLKLTSEEIISERTEPKSVSTSAAIEQANNEAAVSGQQQQLRADRLDLPARAVSLGPELGGDGDGTRSRRARSDAGRRRSLERSVGVDLDSALPASSFMKQARLSPLIQSSAASPQQAPSRTSFGCSPEPLARNSSRALADVDRTNTTMNTTCVQQDEQIYGTGHYDPHAEKPIRCARMLDYNRQALQGQEGASPSSGNMGHLHCPSGTQFTTRETRTGNAPVQPVYSSDLQQLSIFKSAPDVRQLGDDHTQAKLRACDVSIGRFGQVIDQCNSGMFEHCDEADILETQQQHRHVDNNPSMMTRGTIGRSNLSSYAVPLCTTVKRPPQQAFVSRRQCRSCPNSLRRKRRPPSANSEFEPHEPAPAAVNESNVDAAIAYLPTFMSNCCSCQRCQTQHQQQSFYLPYNHLVRPDLAQQNTRYSCCDSYGPPAAFECPDCAHVADIYGQDARQQPTDTHWHHHQPIHHHHFGHHQLTTRAAPRTEPMRGWVRPGHELSRVGSSSCPFEQQASRAASDETFRRVQTMNQASRPHSSQSVRSVVQYGLYESDLDDDGEMSSPVRSQLHQSDHFADEHLCQQLGRPSNQSAYTSVVKPVRGYDQTMSRACLKSRQRSRSQPPSGDEINDNANSTQHLTKSMENVEKLIMEVQNELRALKRQPLGSVHIDMKAAPEISKIEPAKTTSKSAAGYQQQRIPADESEERNSEAKQQFQQDNSNKQLSYSSATRRAGQFKCAGAIRKAGFLSVKKWILKRRQSIELARKQGWKRYWVCLRGTALLFHSVIETKEQLQQHNQNQADSKEQHENRIDLSTWIASNCSGQSNVMAGLLQSEDNQVSLSEKAFLNSMSQCYIEKEPRHLIIIDGAIAQPIPEHPRRDFVFCLSTTFGDAYLFQAGCQLESDNWIAAIHNACAASIARDLVRDEAIKLFETKIKHFELEADKKSFLRHRLESRLTSMSSMCNISRPNELNYGDAATDLATKSHRASNPPEASAGVPANVDSSKKTMQSLLCQLSQQLLALDSYIEQLHCEIYQLRCYLSSCSDQNMFYHNLATSHQSSSNLALITARHHDLPHPKSLLMHVSKPTKLLLIKLGVFTVSSFHAFIHARQESAKNILHSIQNQSGCPESPIVELRIRSQSMSEALVSRPDNAKLDTETESLIELTNLRTVPIVLSRLLFNKIRREQGCQQLDLLDMGSSDDCYTIQDCDESIQINTKLNPSSNSSSIIKQVLKILVPNGDEFGFLNYYLQLIIQTATSGTPNSTEQSKLIDEKRKEDFIVVKRKETLADWSNYVYIELLEKIVFRLELARSQMDDDESTAPFGISVEGQLLSSEKDNMLNVYCSYIEWGSVADKAGLKDEDEFLMINGIPVGDLDLMFVECIIQDATKLRAVVRSNRRECPAKSKHLDQFSWRSLDGDGTADGEREAQNSHDFNSNNRTIVSQVITDEYLTSLVCPPPPAKTSAFLRTDTNLLRQKSDLGVDRPANTNVHYHEDHDNELKFTAEVSESSFDLPKSKSHHLIDDSAMVATEICRQANTEIMQDSSGTNLKSVTDLAKQLKQKTEQVTRLLGGDLPVSSMDLNSTCVDHNVERLKKSVLELFETEYAYLRHLETIVEHYMDPLREISFLNIIDLRSFSQTVFDLLKFQQKFFSTLTKAIFDRLSAGVDKLHEERKFNRDDYDRFNWIVQQIDSFKSMGSFVPLLSSIANSFSSEADKFKIYASYCVAYSKLLRILHPKSTASATNFPGASTITSIPNSLNTFVSSSGFRNPSGIGNLTSQHRDTKQSSLIDLLTGPEDRTAHLKQLNEFLSNLDSSSSSASFSLQRTWTSDEHQRSGQSGIGTKPNSEKQSFICPNNRVTGTSNTSNMPYQKNAHHQNFESYLIKPIQRIVKYPMLLNSILLAAQGRSGESIYNDLQMAIKQLEMVISYVNDSQRVHDEFGIVFDQIERQFFEQQALDCNKNSLATIFGPHQPPITLNIMELLYSGPVSWLNVNDFAPKTRKTRSLNSMLFVFKSCAVLICKEQIKVSSKKKNTSKLINETSPNQPIQHQSGGLTSRVLHWSSATTGENVGANEQVYEIVTYQTLIPVSEVQVRTISRDTSGKGTLAAATPADDQDKASLDRNETTSTEFKWELFQCSSSNSNSSLLTKTQCSTKHQPHNHHRNSHSGKVYLLSNSSNEERNSFLRKIRLTIRESVRNMSLPNTTSSKSSLSNKSQVIKKLSISSASSGASNTNICTSTSLSPPESSEGLDPMTQEQSTTIKCEPYEIKRVHEASIEVKT